MFLRFRIGVWYLDQFNLFIDSLIVNMTNISLRTLESVMSVTRGCGVQKWPVGFVYLVKKHNNDRVPEN